MPVARAVGQARGIGRGQTVAYLGLLAQLTSAANDTDVPDIHERAARF
ncbi:hypothetical protein HXP44_09825 [Streptomyces sioyaensis]|nr:hypothetical protein [Streptomyces sioyaensis]MBM4792343.1 hypothetical protein [Streptomyces sioyaensis]